MLQIQTEKLDICRISKLLAKYDVNTSITDQIITLEGDISNELIDNLCNEIKICAIRNFKSETTIDIQTQSNIEREEKDTVFSQPLEEYDLIYPQVKRGEVYRCDFGKPYGSEQGNIRYAIIIQNEYGNLHSPTTIVLACTTEQKNKLPVHYNFYYSSNNMSDYDPHRVGVQKNIVMAEQIKTVDKRRLRKFIGTMNPKFMDKVQDIIDISLQLRRETKCVVKNVSKERKDLNIIQIQLLSIVDINELLKISQSNTSVETKAEKILKLFGFDLQKKGVYYLFKAILMSHKSAYFNLETLSESISKSEDGIEKEEIKRLIVARVKEQLKIKKVPTIDFIRLVNSLIAKREEEHEEINI